MSKQGDLDVAALAAIVGGRLNQIDQMTLEPVNKSALNRGGGKSNRLDPRDFLPQRGQAIPVQNFDENIISNEISTIPIPDDLKANAIKYMVQPTQSPTQSTVGNIQTIQNQTAINTPILLLEIDKKLDTIIEKLELICKSAKIVRK